MRKPEAINAGVLYKTRNSSVSQLSLAISCRVRKIELYFAMILERVCTRAVHLVSRNCSTYLLMDFEMLVRF